MASSANDAASYSLTNGQDEITRPLAGFPKSIWTDRFKPIVVDDQVYEMQTKEIERLKEEVESMLISTQEEGKTTIEKLILFDTLQRLGISYHFDKQIDSLLEEIFLQNENSLEENLQNDLYATALLFRLLRDHSFNISSGIFYEFLDSDGNFKESLANDKKGLLSLYEATYLRTKEENILAEALSFTITHLRHGQEAMPSSLAKEVNHALEQPLHLGVPRIEALHFISVYEEDDKANSPLLRLAKLDYNHLQILYRKELDELLSFCRDWKTTSKVPFARNRLVESYFWALAMLFEPQYSLCRSSSAKAMYFITLIDDTYDAYGSFDELKAFRDATERWDVKEIDGLPEYMEPLYIDLINFCEWMDQQLVKSGKSRLYTLSMCIEEWKRYVRANYTQSLWFLKKELPAFEDYQEIALITVSFSTLVPACFLFMERGTENVFYWLQKHPKILKAASAIARFINDICSHEREKERGATGLECYMKHYNVSEKEAKEKLEEIAAEAWKDLNEELIVKPTATPLPREILRIMLNLARITEVTYKGRRDGYTDPSTNLEPHIVAVLLDLIVV